MNVFLNVVVGVSGAISALIILLTMYTTVTERTRQIGVLKSLGMSNAKIAWTIVQEALLISFFGIGFGLIATYVLSIALAKWSTLTVEIEPSIVNPADVEMLEDLVLVAVTEAQKKAAALAQEEMGKLTGGMDLPFKLPF